MKGIVMTKLIKVVVCFLFLAVPQVGAQEYPN